MPNGEDGVALVVGRHVATCEGEVEVVSLPRSCPAASRLTSASSPPAVALPAGMSVVGLVATVDVVVAAPVAVFASAALAALAPVAVPALPLSVSEGEVLGGKGDMNEVGV